MVGLILIVLLLVVGLLLYLRFAVRGDQGASTRERYQGSQLGQTFVNSLLKTEIECQGRGATPIRDVIAELGRGESICDDPPTGTVAHLNETIEGLLEHSLDRLMVNYRLLILRPTNVGNEENLEPGLGPYTNSNYPEPEQCGPAWRSIDANQVSIPLAPVPGTIYVRLERCS